MQTSSKISPVFDTRQISQLCVDYFAKDLGLIGDMIPSTIWISTYLEYLPIGKHGIVTLALLGLRNFQNQSSKKSVKPTGLLAQTPLQPLFALALLKACDISLSQYMSPGIVELKIRVTELACKDPVFQESLVKAAPQPTSQDEAQHTQSTSIESSQSTLRSQGRPRIDPLYSLVQSVQDIQAPTRREAPPHTTEPIATLDLPDGSEHGAQRLMHLAAHKTTTGLEVSSHSYSTSPEVQQWEKNLNVLRGEFEAVVRSVGVGEDVRKFERELFSKYIV